MLHIISDFIDQSYHINNSAPTYYYEGISPQNGELLRLPRTPIAKEIAKGLMQQLANNDDYSREGKMYGILLVELPNGEQRILKAFSGLLNGCHTIDGWVPPIPGRDKVALAEAYTLAELDAIKQELITLKQLPQWQQYQTLSSEFEQQLKLMSDRHRSCKQQRQEKRQILSQILTDDALNLAINNLDKESQQEGIERRNLKRDRNEKLQPLKAIIENANARITELRQRRKMLSKQLQTQMYAAYRIANFAGQSRSLQELMPRGLMPTGTGDCCAPKLLHYAAINNLKPLAMAEFWWGNSSINMDKIQGEFYGACVERCQPLMGFLLSGLSQNCFLETSKNPRKVGTRHCQIPTITEDLPIIYEDEWLIAVNKPSGLLSVPGRYRDRQDSVLSRLRQLLPDSMNIIPVHRLDLGTSGIILLARSLPIYRELSRQFQYKLVKKVYEAVLSGNVVNDCGEITLPLWGDPDRRPYQQVDIERGKPSLTHFQVMAREGEYSRVKFIPLTGRTHQIRVHAADKRGLGIPILGDRLYGCQADVSRLHLHARELYFQHPQLGKNINLEVETPF
ncbi:pseudouridine synthase [Kamptonema animale CS-326]|jgi:tRNA pseudouridine32 synthase/23S rRNA pseudouridine746 synthase|uniref:RluA family pseudouridine synthase n=1 Tax=Kamptonema animale TaxID=92934 RepID=UPI00232BCC74|nr:RluA family pseudouridine synthase [Kamptonema animale]MDB9513210.1 pseudouridine synthase [Kamptonema animale CS-326]